MAEKKQQQGQQQSDRGFSSMNDEANRLNRQDQGSMDNADNDRGRTDNERDTNL